MRENAHSQDKAWQRPVIRGFVLTIGIFVVAWLWLLLYQFTNATYSYATNNAETLAQSAAVTVSQAGSQDLDELLAETTEGKDIRIQVFDGDFMLIGDSQADGAGSPQEDDGVYPAAGTTVDTAPELTEAVENGTGVDRRLSAEGNVEQVYAARTCVYRGDEVIVRVSTDSRALADTLAMNQAIGLGLLFACLLATALICYVAFTHVSSAVRRSERVKTQFVANASHELKTPLAGIKLLSETVVRSIDKGNYERLPELATRIDQQTERLEGIVNRLVDISRNDTLPETMEDGLQQDRLTDFVQAVTDSYAYHGMLASDKKLDYSFEVEAPKNAARMVSMPTKQARVAIDNVIENAIQYTQSGYVRVRVRQRGKNIVLTVEDSGQGIPKREQGMVFERFYRAKSTAARNPQGTGLGLSIVRDSVQAAGGTVTISSKEQEGTTVTITLPTVDGKKRG